MIHPVNAVVIHVRIGAGGRVKAAACHALKNRQTPRKIGRNKAERKTPGNEVVFWLFSALFFFNKMSKKRFPAAPKGQQRREALPKNNPELPGVSRQLLHGDP